MKTSFKRVIAVGACVTVCSIAWIWTQDRVPAGTDGSGLAAAVATPPLPDANVALACREDAQDRYSFEYESSSVFAQQIFGGISDGPRDHLDIRLSGMLSQQCVGQRRDGMRLSLALGSLVGHVRGSAPGFESSEDPAKILSFGVFWDLDITGESGRIYLPQDAQQIGQHLVRDLLSLRSFQLPIRAGMGETWVTQEQDLLGVYDAQYRVESRDVTQLRISKVRTAYHQRHANKSGTSIEIAPETKTLITLDVVEGRVLQLDARLRLRQLMDGKVVAQSEAHLKMNYEGSLELEARRLAALRRASQGLTTTSAWITTDLSASDVQERLDRRLQEQQLGDRTWNDLKRSIESSEAFDTDTFLSTKALLVLRASSAKDVQQLLLRSEDSQRAPFQMASGALAAAGTPQAQTALCESVAHFDGDPTAQNILVGLLGRVQNPSPATRAFLEHKSEVPDVGDGLANTARLALGAVASRLDRPQREEIVAGLRETLTDADSLDGRVNAILALGNTRSPQVIPALADALAHRSELVREAGCFALGQQDHAPSYPWLLRIATQDTSQSVRIAALDALASKHLEVRQVESIVQLALQDRDAAVRQAALRVVGTQERKVPGLLAVLETIQREDPAKEVRQLAELIVLRVKAST